MKINKTIKVIVASLLGIILVLFVILVVHIATAKPVQIDNAHLQITRIDFNESVDSLKAKEIQRDMKKINGVINPKFFVGKNVLVYYHDNRITNSEKVFNELNASNKYKASRFILPANLASAKVCPVMNEDSFSYKFSRGIQRIFN